jgi:hypothetical protein
MFHVLKKFRKSADGNCFQLYRKIIHVPTKEEYRKLFRELKKEIYNDKELEILRIFDMNSDKYCYSQIPAKFVGSSISNSINEKFHDILKSSLPYATKYIKAIKVMVESAARMNECKEPDVELKPFDESLNIPEIKQYRTLFAANTFRIITKGVAKAGTYMLLTQQEEKRENLGQEKYEGDVKPSKIVELTNKDSYLVKTKLGHFKVFKQYDGENVPLNDRMIKQTGKWYCCCEYEQKTGILCSHLAKVLMHRNEDFLPYLHPRWMVKGHQLTKRMLNYKYVSKFLKLRSRHKIKVKGFRNRGNPFDHFTRDDNEYDSSSMSGSQAQSIANDLEFPMMED